MTLSDIANGNGTLLSGEFDEEMKKIAVKAFKEYLADLNPIHIIWWILGIAILALLGHARKLLWELLTKFWEWATEGIRRLCCCPNKKPDEEMIPLDDVVSPPLPPRIERHPEQLAPIAGQPLTEREEATTPIPTALEFVNEANKFIGARRITSV